MSGEDNDDNRAPSPDTVSSGSDALHPDGSGANLKHLVLELLQRFPLGLSEYDLIKAIQATGHLQFRNIALWDKLSLFQTHFVLFHTLYTLRQEVWQERQYVLEISPLKIILYAWGDSTATGNELAEHDPLRDYYLDIRNLDQTTAEDVTQLLTDFWVRLTANEQRAEALKILELADPVDFVTIKKQYRRLAMLHHPDRGGDHVKLQTINIAMEILQKSEVKKVLK